jgi:glutamate--cysteine ligase
VVQLRRIFLMAGLNVRIGSISPEIKETTVIDLPGGEQITLEPVIRSKRRLGLKDFDPCTILLNNDLSAGAPGILEDLHEQYLLPPLHAGWSVRRKSKHFKSYEEVSKRFGKLLGIDPWLINPMFGKCGGSQFCRRHGHGVPAKQRGRAADQDPPQIQGIRHQRKALRGRQGRQRHLRHGHHDGARCQGPGRAEPQDQATRWPSSRTARTVSEVIIQEGVLTNERMNDAVAEPVVYMMDRYVVGGFYRIHAERGVDENLNAPGSSFVPLAFAESTHLPQPGMKPGASAPNRFYMYGVIGRLAMLAASYELEATDPDAEVYD